MVSKMKVNAVIDTQKHHALLVRNILGVGHKVNR
ncbi:hypothetical protein ABIA69_001157 [Lysinibacillus parviboronicapiens]|uniref:50S ribosomal protein L30 n=1 Tax=Lysinibacillus parviboronicapiens TaxID=436516 RepID=A0ABV2PH96_9BACI